MWNPFQRKTRRSVPLEAQLETLASCGIALAPGFTADTLTASEARARLEAEPYMQVLAVMGEPAEPGAHATPGGYLSDNIGHLDTECIETPGDYAMVASRLRTLAQGDLPLEQIEDDVDIEGDVAWIAFHLNGQAFRWDAEVQDDWVDPTILSRFADLLVEQGHARRFTYIDLGGQDCLIGCSTPDQRSALQERTGLKVEWLS